MNVTKNKIIEALSYLGEYPKSSLKKQELIEKLNEIYSEKMVDVVNIEIYHLLKKLVEADEDGIDVKKENELEVDFLEGALIIEDPIIDEEKIHIKFNENMKSKFIEFINNKNENNVKKNQVIVDLMINIVDVYGIIQEYEMLDMLNKLLDIRINIKTMYTLLNYQIDLRNEIIIVEKDDDLYFMNYIVDHPEEIIAERESRDLYYKPYTIKELDKNSYVNLINSKEARELLKFMEKKELQFARAREIVFSIIIHIMKTSKIDINNIMEFMKNDLDDIDEANEYLQLVMNLHNSIPHYSLYGYSPNDLIKMQIEEQQRQEQENKKKKIGRNDSCPCRFR